MYDMYPDWGPARHRTDQPEPMSEPTRRPRYWERELTGVGAQAGGTTSARDAADDRPDDS